MNEYCHPLEKYPPIILSIVLHSSLLLFFVWLERDMFLPDNSLPEYTTFSLEDQAAVDWIDQNNTPQSSPSEQAQSIPKELPGESPRLSTNFVASDQPLNKEPGELGTQTQDTVKKEEKMQQSPKVIDKNTDSNQQEIEESATDNNTSQCPQEESVRQQDRPSDGIGFSSPSCTARHARKRKRRRTNLTFADLANGFLKSLKSSTAQPGSAPVFSYIGGSNAQGELSAEELKYASYLQKFFWFLRTTFESMPTPQEKGLSSNNHTMGICTILKKDGSLKHLEITMSSGVKELDFYIEKLIRKASPYPPLPEYFKQDTMTINFYLRIMAEPQQQISRRRISSQF